MECKFKIGDKVEVIDSNVESQPNGSIDIVTAIEFHGHMQDGEKYIVELATSGSMFERRLKLVESVSKERKIQVTDTVKIINTRLTYTTYFEWANAHKLTHYMSEAIPEPGSIGIVKVVEEHQFRIGTELLGVLIDGVEYIIGSEGVELVHTVDDIKFGSKVKVVREVPSRDLNGMGKNKSWYNAWAGRMSSAIGKEYIVGRTDSDIGVYLSGLPGYGFPLTSLQLVQEESSLLPEPVVQSEANGFNADGEPFNFVPKEHAAPFMKAKTRNGQVWVVGKNIQHDVFEPEDENGYVLFRDGHWLEFNIADPEYKEYDVIEIYNPPKYNMLALNVVEDRLKEHTLIWRNNEDPKVAARRNYELAKEALADAETELAEAEDAVAEAKAELRTAEKAL